jgi:hypothetical protein
MSFCNSLGAVGRWQHPGDVAQETCKGGSHFKDLLLSL